MGLQGADRVLDVLEVLGGLGTASLSEVSEAAGLPRSAAHRVLVSLTERGYATRDGAAGYRLGPAALRLAARALDGVDLRERARPALTRLAADTGETVHLVVVDGDAIVYVDKVESDQPVRMASFVGMRGALHSTACGKAILAHLPPDEARTIVGGPLPARTARTITDLDRLETELARTRARGWAVDDRENEDDVRCVAVAVVDAAGRPAGAVSVSAPAYRLPRSRLSEMAGHLTNAVASIAGPLSTEAP